MEAVILLIVLVIIAIIIASNHNWPGGCPEPVKE